MRLPLRAGDARCPRRRAATVDAAERRAAARVLVVDDNDDAAEMLARAAARRSATRSRVAHDGVAALAARSTTFQPDVAVLDIGLPVMDGYELARRLREQLGGGDAAPDRAHRLRPGRTTARAAREAGFDEHLVKPVALDMLEALLDRLR